MANKELKEALEEYADKIHQRWLNARDRAMITTSDRHRYWRGVEDELNGIELDLRKMLKADEALAKANVSRIRFRSERR